jgi:hypothetical protein
LFPWLFGSNESMSPLTLESLEQRVAALERKLAEWSPAAPPGVRWKDWRQAVGQFTPSELSEEVDAAGRAIREADRQRG